MKISESLTAVLSAAFNEARNRRHEYMTPEHVLYAALFFQEGRDIVESTGGDVEGLQRSLKEFLDSDGIPYMEDGDPGQSEGFQSVMENAILHVASAQKSIVRTSALMASAVPPGSGSAAASPRCTTTWSRLLPVRGASDTAGCACRATA